MIRHPLAIQLDPEQRQQVFALMRGIKTEYRLKQRATLIWQVAEDHCSPKTVARTLGVCVKTVRKWCERFRTRGVPGLDDAPRSGAPYHLTPLSDVRSSRSRAMPPSTMAGRDKSYGRMII